MNKKEIQNYIKLSPSEKLKYDEYKARLDELYWEHNEKVYKLIESKLGQDYAKIQNKILELSPEFMEMLDTPDIIKQKEIIDATLAKQFIKNKDKKGKKNNE